MTEWLLPPPKPVSPRDIPRGGWRPWPGRGPITPGRYMTDPAARRYADALAHRHGIPIDRILLVLAYKDRDVVEVARLDQRGRMRVRRDRIASNRRTYLR